MSGSPRVEGAIAEMGIPRVDSLARAIRGLSAYRHWMRDQAMLGDAQPEDLEEYVRTTARLLELDQMYWRSVAAANTAMVERQRGSLPLNERRAITDRTLAPFQALYGQYEARVRPLLAQLPTVFQHLEDAQRRRDWVLALDNALTCYALAVEDTVEALREAGRAENAPPPNEVVGR